MDDCNDVEALAWTGATDVCDGIDNNCVDGENDAIDQLTWYNDGDLDSYGDPNLTAESCNQPGGYVSNSNDCNDGQVLAWTGATDVCDGIDNNCVDGENDAIDQLTWYEDWDADGYGDPNVMMDSCDMPSGYVDNMDDCNDVEALAWTGATDVCDGIDNNCVDGENDAIDQLTWYNDGDLDGYGDSSLTTDSCTQPSGYVDNTNDCNDVEALAWTGATEVCDGVDNNCIDGENDAVDQSTWYNDSDLDGSGDPNVTAESCTQPSGYVSNSDDCNDASSTPCLVVDGNTETLQVGTYQYAEVSVINGGTLAINDDVVLEIEGSLFVDSSSSISGDGLGYEGNTSAGSGNGPCPGNWISSEAASGAGYGGLGGEGGTDSSSAIAAGGCISGTTEGMGIAMGSSGGSSDDNEGGAGGASLWVKAETVTVDGLVLMNGINGDGGDGRNSGGGSGGGILFDAADISVSGSLETIGGDGGSGPSTSNDGGGAGAGGRIKIFYRNTLDFSGSYSVDGGLGGSYGSYQYGQDGGLGTYYVFNTGIHNVVCADIETTENVWGSSASGVDLRDYTDSTLHWMGCNGNGCSVSSFYCNSDVSAETLEFGSSDTLRMVVDPGDVLGDTLSPSTSGGCCSSSNPNGICNGFNLDNNDFAGNPAEDLCWALGYSSGQILAESATNTCPEGHSESSDGTVWSSDFDATAGHGRAYQCSGYR